MFKTKVMTTQRWLSTEPQDQQAVSEHWRVCGMHPFDRRPLWVCPICGKERFSVISCWGSRQHLWEAHGVPGKFRFNNKTKYYGPQGIIGKSIRFWKLAPKWKLISSEILIWFSLTYLIDISPLPEGLQVMISFVVFWAIFSLIKTTYRLPRLREKHYQEVIYGPSIK